jgi:RsiW-degrading membrane proteinase PrsW (M82 family)
MGEMLSIFFGIVPMLMFAVFIYWLDRYEKEPLKLVVGVFLWGMFVAAGSAFIINTLMGVGIFILTNSESAADFATGSLIAPIVEETFKGLAVLLVFLKARSEFDSILDGIIYAAVCALGFAATENVYYIYTYGYAESGLGGLIGMVFVRVILVGWQHPFYTAFIGIGLAVSRLTRTGFWKVGAPVLGLVTAMVLHGLHNSLGDLVGPDNGMYVTTFFDWSGWIFMAIFIAMMINREQKLMAQMLGEEVQLGVITLPQYYTAIDTGAQSKARLQAAAYGRGKQANRFYHLCAELSHKKNQLIKIGDEGGNWATLQRLRDELHYLSPIVG